VFLQWDIVTDNTISGGYSFIVQRSGSPQGPWTTISQPLLDIVNFTDRFDQSLDDSFCDNNEEVNLISLAREIYYQVVGTDPNGSTFTSPAVNLDGLAAVTYQEQEFPLGTLPSEQGQRELDPRMRAEIFPRWQKRLRLLRRKILRDEYIAFRQAVGIPLIILKRRHFGVRCDRCYDPLTRASTQTKCQVCYGTSWNGGYFTGIETFGQAKPAPVQSAESGQGTGDIRATQFTVLAFPKIEQGDLIVEVTSDRRWLVQQVTPTELRRVMVHQRIFASEIGRQSIEYYVPCLPQNSGTLLTNLC
jgi:hypothetical protein